MPTMGQTVSSLLLAEGTWSEYSPFGIALWTGLAVLTVSMMIIMRTRWGQAQPLSKCVALSVFAHILFIAYAYGTRLIFDAPAPVKEEVIRVAFITDHADAFDAPDKTAPQEQVPSHFSITSSDETVVDSPSDAPSENFVESTPPAESIPDVAAEAPDLLAEPEPIAAEDPLPEPEAVVEPPVAPEQLVAEPIESPPVVETQTDVGALPPAEELANDQLADAPNTEWPAEAVAATDDATGSDALVPINELTSIPRYPTTKDPTAPYPDTHAIAPVSAPPMQPIPRADATNTRVADGTPLPRPYQHRQARNRLALAEQRGATERTEQAVEAALKWLASHQSEDGRWDVDRLEGGRESKVLGHDRKGAGLEADTGITGLALLAFLSAGHTHFEGEYRRNVQRGLEFILGEQATDGNLAGQAKVFARMYCHGMATLAICEAYAMTGDHRMRQFVEQAVGFTINSQDPVSGGWRYMPADRGDMSQFGWQVMALKSAELAGITVPGETRAGMIRFLLSVSKGENRGLASYRPSERASETMTAEALACRFFLGIRQDDRAVDEATAFLRRKLPSSGETNLYYWYYGTMGLFQTQALPSARRPTATRTIWPEWNQALQQQLLSRQQRVGDDAGSFSPDTVWGSYGGRVYSTAMATLCLEVYYRYLPLYEPPAAAAAASRNVRQYRTFR